MAAMHVAFQSKSRAKKMVNFQIEAGLLMRNHRCWIGAFVPRLTWPTTIYAFLSFRSDDGHAGYKLFLQLSRDIYLYSFSILFTNGYKNLGALSL